MRVNSMMFFSFSSEIVMFYLRGFCRRGRPEERAEEAPKARRALRSAPLAFGKQSPVQQSLRGGRVSGNAMQYPHSSYPEYA